MDSCSDLGISASSASTSDSDTPSAPVPSVTTTPASKPPVVIVSTPDPSVNVPVASASAVKPKTPGVKTVGFIGLNELVRAILKGIKRTNLRAPSADRPFPRAEYLASKQPEDRGAGGEDGLVTVLAKHSVSLEVLQEMNVQVAMRSDLIFLATAPDKVNTILAELRAANALSGKVLVSLIAGVTIAQMEEALFSWNGSQLPVQLSSPCCILRARPTMASWLAKSITAISHPSDRSQSKEALDLVDSFFLSVGSIYHFPEPLIDSAAVLYGEAPAFFALFCDAIVDGAVVGGLNRGQAERMTVKALEGTSDMLSILEKPSSMREKLCASPGNTSECIMALERGGVRGKISTAMWDCMLAALSPN